MTETNATALPLQGLKVIEMGQLIAGPFANAQDAEGACSLFKKADRPCAATVYAGDAL